MGRVKTQNIKIRVRTGQTLEEAVIPARIYGHFAIHRPCFFSAITRCRNAPASLFDVKSWSVTHLPTGLSAGALFPTLRSAYGFVRAIRGLMDWGQVKEGRDVSQEIKKQVCALVRSHRMRC